jgi:CubicO group peptidase (beta-lactamase class C family)
MADLQVGIQATADEMVASGAETGLQIAARQHGHVIADVVSGVADPRTGAGVRAGTLFYAASTAKGVAASLAHGLAAVTRIDQLIAELIAEKEEHR